MGQEMDNWEMAAEGLPDPDPPAHIKPVEHSYTRELLLSFADLESCKQRPQNLDPVVWRDAPAADGAEGGIAIPAISSRGLVRRDREGDTLSKSPVDIPEWRKDSWRAGGGGSAVPQGPRRKPYDEEPPGNAFSNSYPPRPAGNWGDNGHPRTSYERSGLQGQGSGRWDHRGGLAEREPGRPFQKWDGEEIVGAPVVPPEALRPAGSVVRPGWLPAERDGLLGSGGGLYRTYTGNFPSPSTLRAGPERQMSMGAPERQMSMGPLERQMSIGLERQMSVGPAERQMGMGLAERQMSMGPLERQMSMGPPERQMSMGPLERQMSMGPPERQMNLAPPERQMSMGLPERQNSLGRVVARNVEQYHPARPVKGPAFARREDTDFVNEETFGFEESSTDDRSEQERKRRESFELMRKDHHRELQKQQKLLTKKHAERMANPESVANRKHDESTLWDSTLSSEGMSSLPPRSPKKSSPNSEETSFTGVVSIPVVGSATPRPAIPPGFAKVVQQMQATPKASPTNETPLEGDIIEMKDNLKQAGLQSESAAFLQDEGVGNDVSKVAGQFAPTSQDTSDQPEVADTSAPMKPSESVVLATPSTEALENMSQQKRSGTKAGEEKGEEWNFRTGGIADDTKQEISTYNATENNSVAVEEYNKSQESLLDKWFGRPESGKGPVKDGVHPSHPLADELQLQNSIAKEDAWSEADSKMSKFAQWFHPEEDQAREAATDSSDILSLFPKGGTLKPSAGLSKEQALSVQEVPGKANSVNLPRSPGRVLPMPSGPSLEDIEKGLTASASSGHEQSVIKEPSLLSTISLNKLDVEPRGDTMSGSFGEHSPVGKFKFQPRPPLRQSASRSSPVFLTCEDIEQSMLAEAGTTVEKGTPKPTRPARGGGIGIKKDGQADSAASRHLLSLLQKGTGGGKHPLESAWSSQTDIMGAPTKAGIDGYYNGGDWGQRSGAQEVGGPHKKPSSDNPTLEALFGKAFMSELRSVEAPLSANAFASDFFGSNDATHAVSGVYPTSRQSSGRVVNTSSNANVSKHWPGTIGPLSGMGWTESNALEANRPGHTDVAVSRTKVNQFVVPDKEESGRVTSAGQRLWGNGAISNIAEGSLSINPSVQDKGSFVSSMENTSFMVGDFTDSPVIGKGHLAMVHNSLDMHTSSAENGDGKGLPSGNFFSGQLRVSEDSTLALSRTKVLSSDEPVIGPSTSFDSTGLQKVLKEDGSAKRLQGEGTTAKFGSPELSAIAMEENPAFVSQAIDSFLLAPRKSDRKEILQEVLTANKIGLGDDSKSAHDRKMADALSDAFASMGKAKDGNARVSPISTAGIPEQASTGLARANSGSMRFKNNAGGVLPTSGFSTFQSLGPSLQHQQSIGALYRSDSSTSLSLQSRQQSTIPVHHHLQQNPSSGTMAMFPPQQFHPQAGLPQQQQLLARTFSNGGSLEFPHVPFGHAPAAAPSRPLPAGHMHFPPSAHGHLSPPGAYHPMGHMGPTPNHFMPPAQMPQRGPVMSPMAEAHIFMQEQALHDPLGLGSKPGSQQGPSLFPLGGHALQSGQGPMFHQPLPHNLRGQQNQLLQGPAPWVVPYSSELMRTASKGHELAGFANGSVGGANPLDRWFGMELSRNVSGIPAPGLMQLSPHGLDAESKMRFG